MPTNPSRLVALVLAALMILAGCVPISAVPPATTGSTGGAAENVRGLLARQLHLDPAAVVITRATPIEWPDACLGTAAEDEICAQVVTPGFDLAFEVDGATYRYHSDLTGSRARLVEAPSPAIGGAVAACLPATATTQRLTNTDDRYCLTYPAEYKVERPSEHETILVIGGLLDAGNARLHIAVSDAAGATAESAADRIAKDFEGFTLERSTTTAGGEPAVVLDGVPGQDINRRVIFVHDGLLYELYIAPADQTLGEVFERMEALQEQVLGSFAFLPADAAPVRDCLTPTNETELFDDAGRGFCLLYPAGFTAETSAANTSAANTPSENTVLISSGSPQDAGAPRLLIEIEDAGGRTARELADAAVAEVQAAAPSHQIDRPFGVTLGYQPVERLDGMPGQELSRQLIAVADGRAYRLVFTPADPAQGDAYGQIEALYDLVLKSFRFLE